MYFEKINCIITGTRHIVTIQCDVQCAIIYGILQRLVITDCPIKMRMVFSITLFMGGWCLRYVHKYFICTLYMWYPLKTDILHINTWKLCCLSIIWVLLMPWCYSTMPLAATILILYPLYMTGIFIFVYKYWEQIHGKIIALKKVTQRFMGQSLCHFIQYSN